MTVDALNFLKESAEAAQPVFFHCTVGEDRTGYLAGLYRIWSSNLEVEEIFHDEMCEKGYSAGNPRKPYRQVVAKIRETLTPTFLRMAGLLRENGDRPLKKSLCHRPVPRETPDWRCKKSSRM